EKTYFALLAWLERFTPVAPDHTIARLRIVAQDPLLDRQLAAIEARLFAAKANQPEWSPRPLLRRLAAARRRLRRRRVAQRCAAQRSGPLPAWLNPSGPPVSMSAQRRVAR